MYFDIDLLVHKGSRLWQGVDLQSLLVSMAQAYLYEEGDQKGEEICGRGRGREIRRGSCYTMIELTFPDIQTDEPHKFHPFEWVPNHARQRYSNFHFSFFFSSATLSLFSNQLFRYCGV